MKSFFALLFLLFAGILARAAEDPQTVKSTIKQVTVFANGAQVNRMASTTIPAGNSILVFSGIAPGVDKNSIQVKAEGDFTVLSVSHRLNHFEAPLQTSQIKKLTTQRDTLQRKIEDITTLVQVLAEEESLVLNNKMLAGQQSGLQIDQLRETAAFYQTRLKALRLEKLSLNRRVRALQHELSIINGQLAELNVTERKTTTEIVLAVNAEKASKGAFTLSYLVPNAGWVPHYDFRVKDISKPVQVFYKAKVYQNSGEAWEDVQLTLSTGDPSQSGQKPELLPWRLSFFDPYVYQPMYSRPGMTGGAYNPNVRRVSGIVTDASTGEPLIGASIYFKETGTGTTTDFNGQYTLEVPAYAKTIVVAYTGFSNVEIPVSGQRLDIPLQEGILLDEVVVTGAGAPRLKSLFRNQKDKKRESQQVASEALPIEEIEKATTVNFKIELPYDIPTDGKPYDVHIKEHELDAYYEYYCAPKLDKDAFLTALVTGWEEYNLLSGEASLFFEGTFLGKSYLDVHSVDDSLELSLGRDKNIVVQRTRIKDLSKKKFLSTKRVDTRAWDIEVRNKKKASINIVIEDQIPITTNKEIEIEKKFELAELDEDTGILTWRFSLEPQKTKQLEFQYTVKYPKKEKVKLE